MRGACLNVQFGHLIQNSGVFLKCRLMFRKLPGNWRKRLRGLDLSELHLKPSHQNRVQQSINSSQSARDQTWQLFISAKSRGEEPRVNSLSAAFGQITPERQYRLDAAALETSSPQLEMLISCWRCQIWKYCHVLWFYSLVIQLSWNFASFPMDSC